MRKLTLVIILMSLFIGCKDDYVDTSPKNLEMLSYAEALGIEVSKNITVPKNECIVLENDEEMMSLLRLIHQNNQKGINELLRKFVNVHQLNQAISKEKSYKIPMSLEAKFIPDCANSDGGFYGNTGFGFGTLNFGFQTHMGALGVVTPFTSGYTLGTSFTFGGTSDFSRSANGDMSFIITGTANYHLFYEDIGTIYSQIVKYRVRIKCDGTTTISNA